MTAHHYFDPNFKRIARAERRAERVLAVMREHGLDRKQAAERLNMTYSEVYSLLKRAEARGQSING